MVERPHDALVLHLGPGPGGPLFLLPVPGLLLARGEQGEDDELKGQNHARPVEDEVPRSDSGLERREK